MKSQLIAIVAAVLVVGCGPSETEIAFVNAAYKGSIEEVKQHLDAGTDVNAKDKYGRTPLHRAALKGHMEIVELLIANRADVNTMTNTGFTPLHVAALKGHMEIAELLIAKGADVNAKENEKGNRWRTPLHYAAIRGEKEIVELLISRGANVNAKTDDGVTPLDWAISHPETAELLRKHGGKTAEELKAEGK
jgi:ankyrin repeat protein